MEKVSKGKSIIKIEEISLADRNNISKGILKSKALLKYILETSVYPREHEQLKNIRQATEKEYGFKKIMSVPADEGQFISMIIKMMNAKKAMEIGVFTGYSLLSTALALPDDGKIIAIDPSREAYEVGLPFIRKAGVEHKIEFIQSEAIPTLNKMLSNGKDENTFDFIFVDADKENYGAYHELSMKLIKVGGVIAYDNTLFLASVAVVEDTEMPGFVRKGRDSILKFNNNLASDPHIHISQISIGDGVTLCRRLY